MNSSTATVRPVSRALTPGPRRVHALLPLLAALALLPGTATQALSQIPKSTAAGAASPAGADASAALNELFKKSMEHFAKGNYGDCIAGLTDMLKQGAEGAGMESLYFTLAAAHFNLQEHQKALDAFQEYLSKFPRGEKIPEAQMGIGQCQMALGNKQAALDVFSEISSQPSTHKERALLLRALLLKESGRGEEALALLRPVVTGALQSDEAVQQACLLTSLEAASGKADSAVRILSFLQQRLQYVDNPLQINALAFEVGDALLGRKLIREALRAYTLVKPKAEVVALQRAKLEAMARRHKSNADAARLTPARAAEFHQANATLMTAFEEGKKILEQVEKVEDFMASLRLRQARAYQELGKHWECVVLLENILTANIPDSSREEILYALCVSHSELQNAQDLDAGIARHQKEFPKGKNAESIAFMAGILLLQKNDHRAAEAVFERMVKTYPSGERAATTLFLLANTRFAAGRYSEALPTYEQYLKRFPKDQFFEESRYRMALCHFFSGDYARAHPALESYVKDFPKGDFLADALYRIAVCYQTAREYAEVVKKCNQWEQDFTGHALTPEIHALLGDALSAQNKPEEAATAYERALASSPGDEVLGYVLMEANKQYQKLGRWDASAKMFREFLEKHPEHPAQVQSVYWLSKALSRDGKLEEAKQMLAEKIAATLADRERDAVEQIITQLAQLCAKRPPQPPSVIPTASAPGSGAGDAPSETPPPQPPWDAPAELHRLLAGIQTTDPLAQARLYFGEAELARLTRKPAEAVQWLDKIADQIPPAALGATLLAQMGDRLLQRGETARAKTLYDELLRSFPRSELLDFAYNGLGQIELVAGRPEEALRCFKDALEKAGAVSKLKEVTLGRAKALTATGDWDGAKPLFEQVAATREWRGEATAESVFFLGEIAFLKKDFAAAVQFFQRVFVAYQKYPGVVAKAYLRAADCFVQLGEPEKALAHLREMVGREKLAGLPETEQGRKRMEALIAK